MVVTMMVKCFRLVKRGLTFTAVFFFASLLMKELTNSVLPPLSGAGHSKPAERRISRTRSHHRAVQPVSAESSEGSEGPLKYRKGAVRPNVSVDLLDEEAVKELGEVLEAGGGMDGEELAVRMEGEELGVRVEGVEGVGEPSLAPQLNDTAVAATVKTGLNMTDTALPGSNESSVADTGGVAEGDTGLGPDTRVVQGDPELGAAPSNSLNRPAVAESPGGFGAVASSGGNEGPGGIPAGDTNYYIVYVTNMATSETIYINPASELFKFRIKACSDAYLLYKQKISSSDKFSYHIGFGYGVNTVIWKKPPEPMTKEFRTPKGGRIDCDRTVSLWVKHVAASFSVGFGHNYDKPYMEWTDKSDPYTTASMTLANPWPKKQAVWFLDMSSVKILRVDTGKEYSYEQLWISTLGRNSVILQVKACRDVHVLLSDKFGAVGNVYEIAIGTRENMLTTMREEKFGPNVAAAETEGILDCNEFKAFWVQWAAGKVQVGRGTKIGTRKILEHTKVNHPRRIKSIAMSTGWGATGRWLFNMDQEHLFPS